MLELRNTAGALNAGGVLHTTMNVIQERHGDFIITIYKDSRRGQYSYQITIKPILSYQSAENQLNIAHAVEYFDTVAAASKAAMRAFDNLPETW